MTRSRDVATQGGLILVKSHLLTTGVSSNLITDVFSDRYDAYKIVITELTTSGATGIGFQLGTSNTGYYENKLVTASYSTGSGNVVFNNTANVGSYDLGIVSTASPNATGGYIELQNPFKNTTTAIQGFGSDPRTTDFSMRFNAGYHAAQTSYTSFTILTSAPTFTGGRVSVYGYNKGV